MRFNESCKQFKISSKISSGKHQICNVSNKCIFRLEEILRRCGLYITKQECPHCHAKGCISSFSHYHQFLIEVGRHGLVEHAISVPRMFCHSCGHIHAVLSSCLIPYRSYSLRFILTLLRYYFLRQYTVQQLCEVYGIAVSTLYAWKQLFFHQKAVWLGVLTDLSLTNRTFLD